MEPIFSVEASPASSPSKSAVSNVASTNVSSTPPQRPKVVVTRKKQDISSPSIKDALAGKLNTSGKPKQQSNEIEAEASSAQPNDKKFNLEKLLEVWPLLTQRYSDQPHLHNTLQTNPELHDNYTVVIKVENSVQQERIRLLKPEMIGFLRRTLQNSKIDVQVVIEQKEPGKRVLTNDQKLQVMIQKNPALGLMKNKFNLDING